MTGYLISGLRVASEIELAGAIPDTSPGETESAVSIRRGPVPQSLGDATASGPTWEMADGNFLLRVPRLARFLISAGRNITVEAEPGVAEREASAFVLGSAFGILLHQRGALVLHGSAVARDGRAVVICGASGQGKSTLAAALCHSGCSFVADDICVIGMNGHGRPLVLPDGRQLKLWEESIARLDLTQQRGDAVRENFEKYFVQPPDITQEAPALAAIYSLQADRPPLKTGIEELDLPDAMRRLEFEAYRPRLRGMIGAKPGAKPGAKSDMLAQSAAVLRHARVFRLTRPRGFKHMPDTVSLVRRHWDALGA